MGNNYQKMRRTNHLVRKKLKELGYTDIVMFGHSRFSKDIYGFDGICKQTIYEDMIRLIWLQIKTGYASKKDKKYISNFCFLSSIHALLAEYIPYKVNYKNKKGSYTKYKLKLTKYDEMGKESVLL